MSEKLDQTRKLGDAFLTQEDEVMSTIQKLRQKAEEQGNLKTTQAQAVKIEALVKAEVSAGREIRQLNALYAH